MHDANNIKSGSTTVGTIPVGFRPITNAMTNIPNDNNRNAWITFLTNGNISEYSSLEKTTITNNAYNCIWFTSDPMPN